MNPILPRALLPHHHELLERSAIAPEVAAARGYWTATKAAELEALGFSPAQRRAPALVVPIYSPTGELVLHQIRPDSPRVRRSKGGNEKALKYETPAGARLRLDVPPSIREKLADPSVPLWITEGARKADAAVSAGAVCVALLGVSAWRGTNPEGGKTALADWRDVALNGRHVYVAFDSDVMRKPEVARELAELHAFLRNRDAKVTRIYLEDTPDGEKVGLDDYLATGGTLEALLSAAETTAAADRPQQTRQKPAEPVRRRTGPAPALAPILRDVAAILRVYVHFGAVARQAAVTLWVASTHVFEQFETTPYLAVTSAEKRSGKTRLMDVLELVVARSWRAVLPSEAVVFRKIARDKPTLLLDEVDAIYGPKARDHEGLRAILNAGHRRGSSVPRCVGEGQDLQDFSVYCPKALAGIGQLPDTVSDRSIPIRLQRKRSTDKVDRFRYRDASVSGGVIRERLATWAERVELEGSRPEIPDALNDRAADGWEVLLAIADTAGGEWPELARKAALELHAEAADDMTLGVRLLSDIRTVFETTTNAVLFTASLIDLLCKIDEGPWSDFKKGKALTPRQLAFLLRAFGIKSPGTVRTGTATAKGYHRIDFEDAWARYLPSASATPPDNDLLPSHRHNAVETSTYATFDPSHEGQLFDPPPHEKDAPEQVVTPDCDAVTDENAEEGNWETGADLFDPVERERWEREF